MRICVCVRVKERERDKNSKLIMRNELLRLPERYLYVQWDFGFHLQMKEDSQHVHSSQTVSLIKIKQLKILESLGFQDF